MMLGGHVLRTWSSTQASISLSSGEAEFYGVVRAAGAALGHQSLMEDMGYKLPVRVWTDSSAAMGVCHRQGLGRLRHIETQSLWVQQKVRNDSIELRKVRGEANPADMFTNYLPSRDKVESLVRLFGCEYRTGRPESAPLLRKLNAIDVDVHTYTVGNYDPGMSDDAKLHDVELLPHHHHPDLIREYFPMARVDDDVEEYLDYARPAGSVPEFHLGQASSQGIAGWPAGCQSLPEATSVGTKCTSLVEETRTDGEVDDLFC